MSARVFWLCVCLAMPAWGAPPDMETVRQHAWQGCIACLEQDIANGADINAQNPEGSTALIDALNRGQTQAATWLLDHGADPRRRGPEGFMAAHYATRHPELLKRIHSLGGDIFARAQRGDTPLHAAVSYGNLRSIVWLMEMGASPADRTVQGRNALHVAVEFVNSQRIVSQLGLAKEAPQDWINDMDDEGETALMKAVRLGRLSIADTLLTLGARTNEVNKAGRTLAHLAVQSANPNAWQWVIQHGVGLQSRDQSGLTALELAAKEASTYLLTSMLTGVKAEARAPNGKSLLHFAVEGARLENAHLLLERYPTWINAADMEGNTAAMLAAKGGRLEMLQLFAARGADFKRTNRQGATALTFAVEAKNPQIVDWLSK